MYSNFFLRNHLRENVQCVEGKGIKVQTIGKKREMHENAPQVGHLHEEHHNMVNLAISVEDVMCGEFGH